MEKKMNQHIQNINTLLVYSKITVTDAMGLNKGLPRNKS